MPVYLMEGWKYNFQQGPHFEQFVKGCIGSCVVGKVKISKDFAEAVRDMVDA